MTKNLKRVGFITVSGLALSSVGLAFAAWTATGDGDATASAGNADNSLTVTEVGGDADLVPGGNTDVSYTVTRTTTYSVAWTTVTQTGPITSDQTGCGEADVDFGTAGVATVAHGLAKDDLTSDFVIADALTMIDEAADACQNAVFTIPVSLS